MYKPSFIQISEGKDFFCVDLTWNDPNATFCTLFNQLCIGLSDLTVLMYEKFAFQSVEFGNELILTMFSGELASLVVRNVKVC